MISILAIGGVAALTGALALAALLAGETSQMAELMPLIWLVLAVLLIATLIAEGLSKRHSHR
jgi:hypothetical protein